MPVPAKPIGAQCIVLAVVLPAGPNTGFPPTGILSSKDPSTPACKTYCNCECPPCTGGSNGSTNGSGTAGGPGGSGSCGGGRFPSAACMSRN